MGSKLISVFKCKTPKTDGWLMKGRILTEEDEGMIPAHPPLLLLAMAHTKSVCSATLGITQRLTVCVNAYV